MSARISLRARAPRWWVPPLATATGALLVTAFPAPLVPVARGYRDLCARYPLLALLTLYLPPLPVALLISLASLATASGLLAGGARLVGTLRYHRGVRSQCRPLPPGLSRVGDGLGVAHRLTFLDDPAVSAFCYGFLTPRIAVTSGLAATLDAEELAAVLAHERHHLRRRDPLRYLLLHALTAAAWMVPLAPVLRQRCETRMELAADRAALAVTSRGALAGALLVALTGDAAPAVGAVGLSSTEARIAHLSGRPGLPAIPPRVVVASLALTAVLLAATVELASPDHLVRMACVLCTVAS